MNLLANFDRKNYRPEWPSSLRETVHVILLHGGTLALCKKPTGAFYTFPGGELEPGKLHTEALSKMLANEFGIPLHPDSLQEFGMLRETRASRSHPETICIHNAYYFLADADFSSLAHSAMEWVDPEVAFRANLQFCERTGETSLQCENEVLKSFLPTLFERRSPTMKEFCNPINVRYQFQHMNGRVNREAADPTMVFFKGRYFLFPSMTAGFHVSDDLVHWEFHSMSGPEIYRYAPDVHPVGDKLYFCASDRAVKRPFSVSSDPINEPFSVTGEESSGFALWDPALFADDDGRIYLYWGCSNETPIYAQELDAETMCPIGERKEVLFNCADVHGWERQGLGTDPALASLREQLLKLGMNEGMHVDTPLKPFIEGAFMVKENSTYYLHYAAPATEISSYANGIYTSDSPLGPFTYQPHNPVSFCPTGYITGAGHGSSMKDRYGNWWHVASMSISVNNVYERRTGLFPAGIDEDGIFFCNQYFSDYPIRFPEGKFDCRSLRPEWMLLSYRKQATASSSRAGHAPELALDESIRTWWCAEGSANEWYQLDLGEIYDVHGIQVNFAEEGLTSDHAPEGGDGRFIDNDPNLHTRWYMEASTDGIEWFRIADRSNAETDLSHEYIELQDGKSIRYLRVTSVELPYGEPFALSGLRVFGRGNGTKPAPVSKVSARRLAPTLAIAEWEPVDGTQGYNVRLGIAPDKLYTSYLIYGEHSLPISILNQGQSYYLCVDSFNESGITEGKTVFLPAE